MRKFLNPDGTSLSRPPDVLLPPSSTGPVVSEDVPLDLAAGTSLRIYRPRPGPPSLALVVFHHGGGFILFSAASAAYHAFCEKLAAALPAVVVSVEYRLAPEHRLPAAYDDAVSALRWLRGQASAAGREGEGGGEELLRGVDYSRCFLMGSSSGANIVYHAGLRVAAEAEAFRPLQVAGHVYNQPYFGGVERTASELAMEDDAVLPLRAADAMWDLALPEWADRGHEFCDPAAKVKLAAAGQGLPRSLVRGNVGDPLIDRQRKFAGLLRAAGVDVVERLDEDGHHAVELFDPVKAQRLFDDVRGFVNSTPTATDDVN